MNTLLEKQVDGLLFMGGSVTEDHLQAFRTTNVPIVLCNTTDEHGKIPYVDIDHEAAAYDAVKLLITNGHHKIAMISGTLKDPTTGFKRFQGYKKALEQANIAINENYVRIGNYRYDSGVEAMNYFLNMADMPTAVFAATDEMAIGAINAIQDSGLTVPNDISVVSIDNSRMSFMVRPELTTVAQPMYDIGAVSMRLLTKLMNKETVTSTSIILPHELIQRHSVIHV